MKQSLAIAVKNIGHETSVFFGKDCTEKQNTNCFEDLSSEWTYEFLKNINLHEKNKINGMCTLRRENAYYRLNGNIEFNAHLECVRCLEPFAFKGQSCLNAYFVNKNSKLFAESSFSQLTSNTDEIELSESDLDTYPFDKNQIDLDELILDSIHLALPDLPHCKEDCKGLCAECGQDLNQNSTCSCQIN